MWSSQHSFHKKVSYGNCRIINEFHEFASAWVTSFIVSGMVLLSTIPVSVHEFQSQSRSKMFLMSAMRCLLLSSVPMWKAPVISSFFEFWIAT